MTFFSRCDVAQGFDAGLRSTSSGRSRWSAPGRVRLALSGFCEDIGILVRYAAGLDYYGRDRIGTKGR